MRPWFKRKIYIPDISYILNKLVPEPEGWADDDIAVVEVGVQLQVLLGHRQTQLVAVKSGS